MCVVCAWRTVGGGVYAVWMGIHWWCRVCVCSCVSMCIVIERVYM